jgi:hypothetical protein
VDVGEYRGLGVEEIPIDPDDAALLGHEDASVVREIDARGLDAADDRIGAQEMLGERRRERRRRDEQRREESGTHDGILPVPTTLAPVARIGLAGLYAAAAATSCGLAGGLSTSPRHRRLK